MAPGPQEDPRGPRILPALRGAWPLIRRKIRVDVLLSVLRDSIRTDVRKLVTTEMRTTIGLLGQARSLLADAAATAEPGERFRLAHFAALRTAAALIAERDVTARR